MCRGYKSGNSAFVAFVAFFDMLIVRSNLSARSREEGTQGAVAILREKRVQGCVSRNSDPMNSILRKARKWDWTLWRDTPWNSQDATGTNEISGKKKGQSGGIIQKRWTSWAKSLRAQFLRNNTWGYLTVSILWQQSSVELGEKKKYNAEQEGDLSSDKKGHFEKVQRP